MDLEYMLWTGPNTSSTSRTKILDQSFTNLSYAQKASYIAGYREFVDRNTQWGSNRPFTVWTYQIDWVDGKQGPGTAHNVFWRATAAEQQKVVDDFKAFLAVKRK